MNAIEQLKLFKARSEELRNTRLIRNGFNPAISIQWNNMQGLRFNSREPDEDDLRSFLITFRQFISAQEPVFLYSIYKLCQLHLISDELKGCLIKSREAWKKVQRNTGIKLTINGLELTPEYVTDLWINGYYFHNDSKKMFELKRLLPHESMLVRNHFLNFLVEATRQILYVSNIITIALKEGLLKIQGI